MNTKVYIQGVNSYGEESIEIDVVSVVSDPKWTIEERAVEQYAKEQWHPEHYYIGKIVNKEEALKTIELYEGWIDTLKKGLETTSSQRAKFLRKEYVKHHGQYWNQSSNQWLITNLTFQKISVYL